MKLLHSLFENVQSFLSLRAAYKLSYARNEHIHRGYGLVVVVDSHIEGLDLLGPVGYEHRTVEHLFGKITFVFGSKIRTPEKLEFEFVVVLPEKLHRVGVSDVSEFAVNESRKSFFKRIVNETVEEFNFLRTVLENISDDVLRHILSKLHIVGKIRKGNFRLDHPEFRGVTLSIGFLRPESRSEGIDVSESHSVSFYVELTGNGKVSGLSEKVLRIIHLSVGSPRKIVEVESRYSEHLPRAFAVASRYYGRMNVDEVPFVEELMKSVSGFASYSHSRVEKIRSRS